MLYFQIAATKPVESMKSTPLDDVTHPENEVAVVCRDVVVKSEPNISYDYDSSNSCPTRHWVVSENRVLTEVMEVKKTDSPSEAGTVDEGDANIDQEGDVVIKTEVCDSQYPDNVNTQDSSLLQEASVDILEQVQRMKCEPVHTCYLCGDVFTCLSSLKGHQGLHTGGKPYWCAICRKRYVHGGNLRRHERSHTQVKHLDTKVTEDTQTNISHKATPENIPENVRAVKRNSVHKCNLCGKVFGRFHSLTVHQRLHTRAKPYPICEQSLAAQDNRSYHDRCSQIGVKLYTKEDCHNVINNEQNECQHLVRAENNISVDKESHNMLETAGNCYEHPDVHRNEQTENNISVVKESRNIPETAGNCYEHPDVHRNEQTENNISVVKESRNIPETAGNCYEHPDVHRNEQTENSLSVVKESPYMFSINDNGSPHRDVKGKGQTQHNLNVDAESRDTFNVDDNGSEHIASKLNGVTQSSISVDSESHNMFRIDGNRHGHLGVTGNQQSQNGLSFDVSTVDIPKKVQRRYGRRRDTLCECSLCGKLFGRVDHLKTHELLHAGVKPYACTMCSKSFANRTALTRHVRVHTGEKPCSCSYCGKSFTQSSSLRHHERRMHTGVKPFRCTMCGESFATTTTLKHHRKLVTVSHLRYFWRR